MLENQGNEIIWENFMKMLLDKLDIPTKADIQLLNERLERLEQLLFQKQPAQKQGIYAHIFVHFKVKVLIFVGERML